MLHTLKEFQDILSFGYTNWNVTNAWFTHMEVCSFFSLSLFFFFFFFLAMPLGLQYLNSLTRVQTWALGSENMES